MEDLTAASVDKPVSRERLVEWLSEASISGYLGLFVGTGFSRAVSGDAALTFEELLVRLAKRLGLSWDFKSNPTFQLKSLPQIASQLLSDYERAHPPSEQAAQRFRETISQLCNVMPLHKTRLRFSEALAGVRPSWIITTNYDLILEALSPDAESVLPTAPLVPSQAQCPIYHIHGHRHVPQSITVTEEDYVGLLGPLDYQRLKLPLLLAESTTLMLGYALGDINVRAALEYARSFRNNVGLRRPVHQGVVIQALYKDDPSAQPFRGPHGEHVLEIDSIAGLLEEIGKVRRKRATALETAKAAIDGFFSDPANAPALQEDPAKREAFLKIVREQLHFAQPTRVIEFLNAALEPIWERAQQDGGFNLYDLYLELLLDILENIDYLRANPVLVAYLADALDRLGWLIAEGYQPFGMAWAASRRWIRDQGRIGPDLRGELRSYARTHQRAGLLNMLRIAKK